MQFVPRRRDHSTTEPRAVATGTYTQQLICSYNAKHLVQNAASIGSGAARSRLPQWSVHYNFILVSIISPAHWAIRARNRKR